MAALLACDETLLLQCLHEDSFLVCCSQHGSLVLVPCTSATATTSNGARAYPGAEGAAKMAEILSGLRKNGNGGQLRLLA